MPIPKLVLHNTATICIFLCLCMCFQDLRFTGVEAQIDAGNWQANQNCLQRATS